MAYCKENKIKCMRLPVNGAFHSSHMAQAAKNILGEIEGAQFGVPEFILYANRTGMPYEEQTMKQVMAEQTSSPVLFEQIIRSMIGEGYDTFVEVGPGKTLTGFTGRIDKGVNTYYINDFESFEAAVSGLKELGF